MAKRTALAPTKDVKINLLPRDPFYDSLIGKGTTWALSVGRYIVIFTELVVILSFLSRFTLDRQVTDLNNAILQKKSIIESYGDLEQNFRTVQRRIDVYGQVKNRRPVGDVFDVLTELTPSDIQLEDLTLNSEGVQIAGRTLSSQSLTRFLTNIQTSPYFTNVTVENISNKDARNPGFEFRLRANLLDALNQSIDTNIDTE